jgi:phage terminase large subunit-like protein
MSSLSPQEAIRLQFTWEFWARPDQLEPKGKWSNWLALAGRGFGKTRTGAEWVRKIKNSCSRIALIGETAADVRDVMVEGESGILQTSPPWDKPEYIASHRELRWNNGAIAKTYSSEEPDQLRGPQHEAAWVDELAKYRYAQEVWDQLQFGLRLGAWPRSLITTTPRPIPVVKSILAGEKTGDTVVVRGSTFANAANLAPSFLATIRARYEGTRLGRQELNAEILDDLAGALWSRDMIDQAYLPRTFQLPKMKRVGVGVDPSGFDGEKGDSQGIIPAGLGEDGIFYVFEDCTCRLKPEGWGRRVVDVYKRHMADFTAVEKNFGGGMCRANIHHADRSVCVKDVTASRGKHIRAEPIAALYEQGRVKHVVPMPELEDQMCNITTQGYEGEGSPDRLDALVWVLTELSNPVKSPSLMLL